MGRSCGGWCRRWPRAALAVWCRGAMARPIQPEPPPRSAARRPRSARPSVRVWQRPTFERKAACGGGVVGAGAGAGRMAAALGEPVPVETVAPMLMITSRVPHFIDPVVILRGRKLSFKQFANGTVLICGGHLATPDQDRNETVLDCRSLAVSARTVFELFPVMRGATIVRAWAGIEAKTADGLPVLGPSARHLGLYHPFGFSLP